MKLNNKKHASLISGVYYIWVPLIAIINNLYISFTNLINFLICLQFSWHYNMSMRVLYFNILHILDSRCLLHTKMTALWKIKFSPGLLTSLFLPGAGIFEFICCSSLYSLIFCCQSSLSGPSVFRQSGCFFSYCHLCFYEQSKARGLTSWVLPSSPHCHSSSSSRRDHAVTMSTVESDCNSSRKNVGRYLQWILPWQVSTNNQEWAEQPILSPLILIRTQLSPCMVMNDGVKYVNNTKIVSYL